MTSAISVHTFAALLHNEAYRSIAQALPRDQQHDFVYWAAGFTLQFGEIPTVHGHQAVFRSWLEQVVMGALEDVRLDRDFIYRARSLQSWEGRTIERIAASIMTMKTIYFGADDVADVLWAISGTDRRHEMIPILATSLARAPFQWDFFTEPGDT